MLLGALGEDGCDTGDAEFSGFLDGPLEAIEFEDGEQQVDGQGGVGLQLFMEREEDFSFRDSSDLAAVEKAIGYDIVGLTGLGAQDTGEMIGLLAGESGVRGMAGLRRPCVGDPAASHRAGNREQERAITYKFRASIWEQGRTRFGQLQRLRLRVLAFYSLFTVPCSLIVRVGDRDVDWRLVDEVEGDDGGLALVPNSLGDGEGEQDHT